MAEADSEVVDLTAAGPLSPEALDRIPLSGFHLSGSLPPLFAVRTWSEEVENYRRLAERLGPDQPIYTVSPPQGKLPSDFPRDTEAWADLCMQQFGTLLERREIALMGWSYAGVVALCVAERLAARGTDVRLVALVDSTLPRKKPWGSSLKRSELHHFFVMMERLFEFDDGAARWTFFRRYARKMVKRSVKKAKRALRSLRGTAAVELSPEDKARAALATTSIADRQSREQRSPLLMRAIRIAYLKHKAEPTLLPIALFCTEESRARTGEASLGWSNLLQGDSEVVRVGGTHHTIFATGHIEMLARRLAQSLRTAWENAGKPE